MRLGGIGPGGRERLHYPDLMLLTRAAGGSRSSSSCPPRDFDRRDDPRRLHRRPPDRRRRLPGAGSGDRPPDPGVGSSAWHLETRPRAVRDRTRAPARPGARAHPKRAAGARAVSDAPARRRPPYWLVPVFAVLLLSPPAWATAATIAAAIAGLGFGRSGNGPRVTRRRWTPERPVQRRASASTAAVAR